uniref:50S ribosomal protein L35 n=1 Tax=Nitzschia sp. NIES-3576 TaxID=2083273 RepID=A0A2Z5ZB83_9STRA|nr:ribosomal protein L35 [Nitzschia sp. NIES-3576]
MLKKKNHKASLKRYKIINDKIYHHFAFKNHLLSKKSKKRKRRLSQTISLKKTDIKKIKKILIY